MGPSAVLDASSNSGSRRARIRVAALVGAALALLMSLSAFQVAVAPSATAYELGCHTDFTKYVTASNGGRIYAPARSDASGANRNLDCYMWANDISTRPGYESVGVMALQRALNRCYGESLAVDGKYGYLTESALWRAQRAEGGIAVDGRYGPETARNLRFAKVSGGCGYISASQF